MKQFFEIRTRKGNLDDLVFENIDSIHLEDMDGKNWWLGIYKGKKRITFMLSSKSKISCTAREQDLPVKWVEQEK